MKDKTLQEIFSSSFGVVINMNDTFYYACADSACIGTEELESLEPVIELYGHDAFVAYEAIRRGHDPQIPQRCNEKFFSAKKMIMEISEKAEKYGDFFELREAIAESKALAAKERKRLAQARNQKRNWFSFFWGQR